MNNEKYTKTTGWCPVMTLGDKECKFDETNNNSSII